MKVKFAPRVRTWHFFFFLLPFKVFVIIISCSTLNCNYLTANKICSHLNTNKGCNGIPPIKFYINQFHQQVSHHPNLYIRYSFLNYSHSFRQQTAQGSLTYLSLFFHDLLFFIDHSIKAHLTYYNESPFTHNSFTPHVYHCFGYIPSSNRQTVYPSRINNMYAQFYSHSFQQRPHNFLFPSV